MPHVAFHDWKTQGVSSNLFQILSFLGGVIEWNGFDSLPEALTASVLAAVLGRPCIA